MIQQMPLATVAKLSVDDLVKIILKELQVQERLSQPERDRWMNYPLGSLGSIKAWLFGEHHQYGETLQPHQLNQARHDFDSKFEEASQRLFNKTYVIQNPQQSHRDFVCLTEAGRSVSTEGPIFGVSTPKDFIGSILPHGSLDPVVAAFLTESYRAVDEDLWLASASMLGIASERLLDVLAEHVGVLTGDSKQQAELTKKWKVREIKEWTLDRLPDLKRRYPGQKDAFIDIEDALTTLYTLYRYDRNDSGHPTEVVPQIDPEKTKAMLQGIGVFARRIQKVLQITPLSTP